MSIVKNPPLYECCIVRTTFHFSFCCQSKTRTNWEFAYPYTQNVAWTGKVAVCIAVSVRKTCSVRNKPQQTLRESSSCRHPVVILWSPFHSRNLSRPQSMLFRTGVKMVKEWSGDAVYHGMQNTDEYVPKQTKDGTRLLLLVSIRNKVTRSDLAYGSHRLRLRCNN